MCRTAAPYRTSGRGARLVVAMSERVLNCICVGLAVVLVVLPFVQ